jgi:ATP-binding cassette subfamily F protein uup
MDKLTDHLFIMTGDGKIKDFNGTFTEYRNYIKQEKKSVENKTTEKKSTDTKNLLRKEKKQINNEINRTLKSIESKEEEKEEIMKIFELNTEENPDKIAELSSKLDSLNKEIARLETHWEQLMEKMELLDKN